MDGPLRRLEAFLRRAAPERGVVLPLSGDASTRRYFRVSWERGTTAVAAVYPEPFDPAAHPFLEVHALLDAWGLPVPSVLAVDGERGVVILEDLGDATLQERLRSVDAGERRRLYREAIDSVVLLQKAAAAAEPAAGCFALAFDREKLLWELDFFVEHFLEGVRGARLDDGARSDLRFSCERLCLEIASWPRVLCHRDYHSRNLMWHRGRLIWIDYQDARMGPTTYDLASLLCDAYVDVPDELLDEGLERCRSAAAPGEDAEAFRRRFDLTSAQRTLKALGTFGYQARVRSNPSYLEHVPRALSRARRCLNRQGELGELGMRLARYVEELRA